MLNILLGLIALVTVEKAEVTAVDTKLDESSVVWTATKVVGGGHTGTVNLSEANLKFDGNTLKGGSFVVDMTSINSTDLEGEWKDKLDGHLKSADFFAVEEFKTATFEIKKVKKTANNKYSVTGDISIKGKTESITFPVEVAVVGNQITSSAKISLDRTKFDVKYGSNSFFDSLGDKAISDVFTLDVKLVSTK